MTPRAVTFKGETATLPYTGSEQELTGVEALGLADGQTFELAYSAKGTLPNADPGYPGSFAGQARILAADGTDATANYAVEYAPGTLFITTAGIAGNVTITPADVVETYDGEAHAAGTASASDANGNDVLVEYQRADGSWTDDPADVTATDVADSATVRVRASVPGVYEGYVYAEQLLTITPRPVEVTAVSSTKAYDGTPLTCADYALGAEDFVGHEGFENVFIEGSQTLVGASPNAIVGYEFNALTDPGNYAVSTVDGTLTVTDGTEDDPVDPDLVVVKAHEEGTYGLGETVEFAITATNIYDDARTMTFVEQDGVEITGQATFENVEPGATVSTTARYTVTEGDILAGGFTNTVTVSFEGGKDFEGNDDVVVDDPETHLTVTKVTTSQPFEGNAYTLDETITYEVTVTNDGNLTVEGVTVTDELADAILAEGESAEVGTLAPGESATLHYSYTVTETDVLAGKVMNVATATGTSTNPDDPEVPVDPGTTEDPVETPRPSLFASKTASDPADGKAFQLGEKIAYTVEVINNGNVTITGIVVSDKLEGATLDEGQTDEAITLAPGESATLRYSYTVTESDLVDGNVTNVATATGTDPEGNPVETEATTTVTTEEATSSLDVAKTVVSTPADGKAYAEGETVKFEVAVTNTGNQTLKNVKVVDKLAGAVLAEGESDLIESLAPGASATLHYSYTITADDLGKEFKNVATATAEDGTTQDGETPVIPVAPRSPEPNPDQPPAPKPEQPKPAIPKTADETPSGMMAMLANLGLASLAAGLACLIVTPRRRDN